MKDSREEIYGLMAKINLRKKQGVNKRDELVIAKRRALSSLDARISILKDKALTGDEKAEMEYIAALVQRKALES
jgi:hypothetical protein